jgi:hypothetical protein
MSATKASGSKLRSSIRAQNVRKVFGWSDTAEGAQAMGNSIDAHPVWQFPQVTDRQAGG